MTQQLLPFSQTKVGSQVVLWKFKYSSEAYTDQFGRRHHGCVVYEEIVTTIVEQRTVPGERGISEFTQGFRALTQDGREFRQDWERGGDGDYWYPTTDLDGYKYSDVCRVMAPHRIFATPEGQPARPVSAEVCDIHGSAFMPGEQYTANGCHECYMNFKYPPS